MIGALGLRSGAAWYSFNKPGVLPENVKAVVGSMVIDPVKTSPALTVGK
jgi:hypothetical protein